MWSLKKLHQEIFIKYEKFLKKSYYQKHKLYGRYKYISSILQTKKKGVPNAFSLLVLFFFASFSLVEQSILAAQMNW